MPLLFGSTHIMVAIIATVMGVGGDGMGRKIFSANQRSREMGKGKTDSIVLPTSCSLSHLSTPLLIYLLIFRRLK